MKLRIRANSLRLRLTQGEVQQLASLGEVKERVAFPGGGSLVYTLRLGEGGATFHDSTIAVTFPPEDVASWTASDMIALRRDVPLPDGATLSILVEKDFECLHRNPAKAAEDVDTYPHPRRGNQPE